jgi:hypothetical protein
LKLLRSQFVAVPTVLLFLSACATTAVNMDEPRRVVGTESSVRVDAQITGDEARPGATIAITYEITNQRPAPIAIADLVPETSFDAEARLITVTVGAEVPGNATLPRLIAIQPGEKKTFTTAARLRFALPQNSVAFLRTTPVELRLRVNFLGDTSGFEQLIGIKENGVVDPALADALFASWLERNEIVATSTVPLRWLPRRSDAPSDGLL